MNQGVPQSAGRLILDAFSLYGRYPLLFLILAAGVIVPYELLVLALGSGPFDDTVNSSLALLLGIADLVLVTPLVSALHVNAVADARAGEVPAVGSVARRGIRALPVVAAASVMSGLGIAVGFFALIVPGIYLTLRWLVVAQAAAIERDGWLPALRRSHELVRGHYGHVIVFALVVGVIVAVPLALLGLVFDETTVVSFTVAVIVQVLCISFGALTTALLYFDLRTRRELALASGQGIEVEQRVSEQTGGRDVDPRKYTDETRPRGWYIDPEQPERMRYWQTDDPPRWAESTTRTPARVRQAWDDRE